MLKSYCRYCYVCNGIWIFVISDVPMHKSSANNWETSVLPQIGSSSSALLLINDTLSTESNVGTFMDTGKLVAEYSMLIHFLCVPMQSQLQMIGKGMGANEREGFTKEMNDVYGGSKCELKVQVGM